ncbi:methylated-DNA--[protein]-cysteine S-methyltransferase [Marihabitans asiaticum]|uniref:methylated-DNA--[protein]-cysteine S-methyltransferase n=1 Tax=Marihabitans asiaticum TaxID=415218 RepID=A0A560WID9_9MICO|nr:methylated-DNA--[protein]-cysteine S-methyltransferase [Marihabitans asiaticum]TWD17165.1 methylated-DNA-[protein]-cysteine S-methyltransferase [Marihabitans asiaticum]
MSEGMAADLPQIDDERMARLHGRLVERAARSADLDVAYRVIDSPLGRLVLAATPRGLVRVGFADVEGEERVLAEVAREVSPKVLRSPGRLDKAAQQVEEYLAGRRSGFEIALDLSLLGGFRGEVVTALPRIPYGSTASYGELAAIVERPRAVRAVGTACATNPLPLLLPCHRVVRADGSPGRYRGGDSAKVALLEMESRGGSAADR